MMSEKKVQCTCVTESHEKRRFEVPVKVHHDLLSETVEVEPKNKKNVDKRDEAERGER